MDFDDIKQAIESQHGGTATRLQSVPVIETFEGKTVWEGVVHVFALTNHSSATMAYAWSSPIEGSKEVPLLRCIWAGSQARRKPCGRR